MKSFALVVVSAAGVALAAPGTKDAPKADPQLVGEWRLVRSNGERPFFEQTQSFGADGTRVVRVRSRESSEENRGRYVADPAARPAEIDFVYPADEGGNIRGIYKVDGDTLTLCYQTGKGERPREFKQVDNEISLFVYERVKPKK